MLEQPIRKVMLTRTGVAKVETDEPWTTIVSTRKYNRAMKII